MYCGFDLSTQQLKALIVDERLRVQHEVSVSFDHDFPEYKTRKGVFAEGNEVKAPVRMWLDAVDLVFERMKAAGVPMHEIRGMSGAGQQHGSVYWKKDFQGVLKSLDKSKPLAEQLDKYMYPFSPNWQDSSTQKQCEEIEAFVGGAEALARLTGSRAHHRFTGPQILKLRQKQPEEYAQTERISLVSSWLASILLGQIAPIDPSDVCGMNLWDILQEKYDPGLMELVGGNAQDLERKLGKVEMDGGAIIGKISPYFVEKYGVSPDCKIVPFTGDNPATILSLPLRKDLDAMVSLGTSTTLLLSTSNYVTSPNYHMFGHPTTKGLFMSMLCYKNGSLAREAVRNDINAKIGAKDPEDWSEFNKLALEKPPLLPDSEGNYKFGFYFPLPEIIPIVNRGTYRFVVKAVSGGKSLKLEPAFGENGAGAAALAQWTLPEDDPRAILDGQFLDIRVRSQPLLQENNGQPGRIYAVGGASKNPAILKVMGQVLGGTDGVFRQITGASNACAHGGASKAAWALLRRPEETFEDFVLANWDEELTVRRVCEGYQKGIFEEYTPILDSFVEAETELEKKYHE